MIELQTCPSCKAQSSSRVLECSRCGRSFRTSRPLWPAAALLLVLVAGGLGVVWYTGNLRPIAASGAGDGFGALTAKSDAPVREDLEALSHDFRLPLETLRAITWSWTSAIQRNHPEHQRAAIIDAIVFSVQSHGIRGSLQSYFEEYWALAERGLGPTRIRQVLRSQMFRGK